MLKQTRRRCQLEEGAPRRERGHMLHAITDETFEEEVANSDLPCVIEFTAGWCTLCGEMVANLEALSDEFDGKVKLCTVNTDEQRALRIRFAVGSLPYLVYIADGVVSPLFDELASERRIRERIEFMLDGGTAPGARPLKR